MLPERQKLVLKEIVDRYIREREPVSSRMILEDYGLAVSSATVRNDMSALEAAGYVDKPHSSSGRIPTKLGYRFFVDWLLDLSELSRNERLDLVETRDMRCLEVGETLRQTAFLLGNVTGYVGFVVPPALEETHLERVALARMDPGLALLVIVSDVGIVQHGLVPLEQDLSEEDVQRVTRAINENLRGVSLDEVRKLSLDQGGEGWHDRPVRAALDVLHRLLDRRAYRRLYVEGISNLVGDLEKVVPEEAVGQLVRLIHAVQDEDSFIEGIREARQGRHGLVINVGDCPLPNLSEYSVVTSDVRPHSGIVGVIAPLWMDYGRAFSATTYVANRLEGILTASLARKDVES